MVETALNLFSPNSFTYSGLLICSDNTVLLVWENTVEADQTALGSHYLPFCLLHHLDALLYEPPHDKTNKMACAPSEDSQSFCWFYHEEACIVKVLCSNLRTITVIFSGVQVFSDFSGIAVIGM